jgi:hypothetical protein
VSNRTNWVLAPLAVNVPLLVSVGPAMRKTVLPVLKVVPVLIVMLSEMLLKLTSVVDIVPVWLAEVLVITRLGSTPRRLKFFAAPEAACRAAGCQGREVPGGSLPQHGGDAGPSARRPRDGRAQGDEETRRAAFKRAAGELTARIRDLLALAEKKDR